MSTLRWSDYRIGIICALSLERVAVEAMLDGQPHLPLPNDERDTNVYTFGRIGPHNVVITALGEGSIGMTRAAVVAKDFEGMKLRLVVGIAAGIPQANQEVDAPDIRLGDIVVGSAKRKPAVVCYSQLRAMNGGVEIESQLAPPQEEWLKVVNTLETQHLGPSGPTYLLHLKSMLEKDSYNDPYIMKQNYNIPRQPDRLFKANCVHEGPPGDCTSCCRDQNNLIIREKRCVRRNLSIDMQGDFSKNIGEDYFDYPTVHHGTVACADIVVRDAIFRDKVFTSIEKDLKAKALCIEMESAGILSGWSSCLVIRGISDYGDSHKNDWWQRFAAATAASYMKDLILKVPVTTMQRVTVSAFDLIPGPADRQRGYVPPRTIYFLSDLRYKGELLNKRAHKYHLFMTLEGWTVYESIWNLISAESVTVNLNQLATVLIPQFVDQYDDLLYIWQRFNVDPGSKLSKSPVMAILFMVHLELISLECHEQTAAQYGPSVSSHLDRYRRMAKWCPCPNECGLEWNMVAFKYGFCRKMDGTTKTKESMKSCLLYRLHREKMEATNQGGQPRAGYKSHLLDERCNNNHVVEERKVAGELLKACEEAWWRS